MEYNSFYGGRRGASFIIVKSFKCIRKPDTDNWFWKKVIRQDLNLAEDAELTIEQIDEWVLDNCMVQAFELGGSYKIVNYDEYVIIDTPNKNDKDNGKIYRRGYNYANDPNNLAGAEYIGQIVGPSGMAPQVEMKTIDEVTDVLVKDGLIATEDTETVMRGKNEFTKVNDKGEEEAYYRTTGGTYEPNTNLLPGKYWDKDGNECFNDEIEWLLCSVRDQDSHETTVHLGFKIPYMVTEYTAKTVSPYYHRTDLEETGEATEEFDNDRLVVRTDDPADLHPYFQRWHISIPKGIKGDAFKRLRVTTVEECINNGTTIIGQDNQPIKLQDYIGKSDDNLKGKSEFEHSYKQRKILVYDYYHYDRVAGGDPVALYLGDFNMIAEDGFQIDEDGTIRIRYTHDDTDYYANYLKAVEQIQLNVETGLLQVDYNFEQQYERDENGDYIGFDGKALDVTGLHGDELKEFLRENAVAIEGTKTHYETYLHWVKDIHFDDEGTISWEFTRPEDNRVDNQKVKWIKEMSLNPKDGQFDIYFNYDQEYEVNQGEDTIDEDGNYIVYKTDENGNRIAIPDTKTHIRENLQWVKDIVYDQDGTLTWQYTWKDNEKEKIETLPNFLKWVEGVKLNAATGKFEMDFNYETEPDGAVDYKGDDISGQPTHYETDLTWVKDINFHKDGTIDFIYTYKHDEAEHTDSLPTFIKWVKEIQLDVETGLFQVDFNYDQEYVVDEHGQFVLDEDGNKIPKPGTETHFEKYLTWVKDIEVKEDGTISWTYTTDEDDREKPQYIKWVKEAKLNAETGKFEMDFNYPTEPAGKTDMEGNDISGKPTHYEVDLNWVKDVSIDDEGTITFDYTVDEDKVYTKYLRTIRNITLDPDNGSFDIDYNHAKDKDGNDTHYHADLRWVKDIQIANDGTIKFIYTYGDEEQGTETILENFMKSIKEVTLDGQNGHFEVIYNYDNESDGTPTKYETDLRWVDNFEIDADGTVTLNYTTGPDVVLDQKIKWIVSTSINKDGSYQVRYNDGTADNYYNIFKWITNVSLTDGGIFSVDFNNGAESYIKDIVWANDIKLDADGTVTLIYNNKDTKEFNEKIKWITKIDNNEAGETTATWNDGTTTKLAGVTKWIEDVTLDDNGDMYIEFNDGKGPQKINNVKWLVKSEFDKNAGKMTFTYNNGDTEEYEYRYIDKVDLNKWGQLTVLDNTGKELCNKTIEYPTKVQLIDNKTLRITANTGNILLEEELKWVEDISVENDKFKVTYNTTETKVLDDVLLNQVDKTAIPVTGQYKYHLLVMYTAEELKGEIFYDGETGWVDLGIVKDYNGILVGTNINSATAPELDDPANALDYLNSTYPNGVEDGYTTGKVITIGHNDTSKRFYSYDYDNNEWIYLGDISGMADVHSVLTGPDDSTTAAAAERMPTGSLWFVVEGDE